MPYTTVPLRDLLVPHNNPRRTKDKAAIVALSESILADGVLQNLVVCPEVDGKYRIVTGERRYRALRLLRSKRAIAADYPVPVEIREMTSESDKLRIATVENVQREALNAIDEADAFARMVSAGSSVEEVAAKTGIAPSTVRRRLALSGLSEEAKRQLRMGELSISVGEALTLGSPEQQVMVLKAIKQGAELSATDVRRELVEARPTLAMALFPKEAYTGPLTRDLFAAEDTTYCDDKDLFMSLQRKAVDELVEKCKGEWDWVEIIIGPHVPWWRYRQAVGEEESGMVVAFDPSGAVDIRAGLVRPAPSNGPEERRKRPTRPRPPYSAATLRYVAMHKSAALQATILAKPHLAKAVTAWLLLSPAASGDAIRLRAHSCHGQNLKSEAFTLLRNALERLAKVIQHQNDEEAGAGHLLTAATRMESWPLYELLKELPDADLDAIIQLCAVSCFGLDLQGGQSLERDDLVDRVALDLGLEMRSVWYPDETFLSGLSRAQLEQIILDCGANEVVRTGRALKKPALVAALAHYFEGASCSDGGDEETRIAARQWLPGMMKFPAELPTNTE